MLGRKQSISNEQWIKAMGDIKNIVTEAEIKNLEKQTITDIKAKTKNKKSAYAWSAGKDSIVLGALCEKAGITACVMGVCNLEFADFMAWVDQNKPSGLQIINTGLDMDWLEKNQDLIFPDAAGLARWCREIHIKAQTIYFKEHKLDVLLQGRRKADGNFVGRGDNIYTNGKGITDYSPLSDWPHEMVLAYIAYNSLSLPPIYDWVNGYKRGTHAWPMRPGCKTKEEGWQEIYEIDPAIVTNAAQRIESAKKFLGGIA